MDILGKRAIEITSLAMDGLAQRHKAIASNIANAQSKDYQRITVDFEGQLNKIIETDEKREKNKMQNMIREEQKPYIPNKDDMNYKDFKPEMIMSEGVPGTNNVNIETEMADLAKTGLTYDALATIQQKAFQEMKEIIQRGGRS